jgi:hypothetical protein
MVWSKKLAGWNIIMAILEIWSPGYIDNSAQKGTLYVTWLIGNPWATPAHPTSSVWIQCTPGATEYQTKEAGFGDAAIGLLEIDTLDQSGRLQTITFGDVNQPENNLSIDGLMRLETRRFVERFLSVTVVLLADHVVTRGTVTFFLWG